MNVLEGYVKILTKRQDANKLRQCYVYEIRVDGVVRYIGRGRNGRIYSHLIDAKRTANRSYVKTLGHLEQWSILPRDGAQGRVLFAI
jgi:hypothetical protein